MNTLYHIGGTFYLGEADAIKLLSKVDYLALLGSYGHDNIALLFEALIGPLEADYEKRIVPFLQEFPLGHRCSPFVLEGKVIENPTLWFLDYPFARGKPRTYTESYSAPYIAVEARDDAYYASDIYLLEPHTFRKLPQWKWTTETDDGKRMLTALNSK